MVFLGSLPKKNWVQRRSLFMLVTPKNVPDRGEGDWFSSNRRTLRAGKFHMSSLVALNPRRLGGGSSGFVSFKKVKRFDWSRGSFSLIR